MGVLYFSCNFDVVVQRGEPCLSMLPSWPEVPPDAFLNLIFLLVTLSFLSLEGLRSSKLCFLTLTYSLLGQYFSKYIKRIYTTRQDKNAVPKPTEAES